MGQDCVCEAAMALAPTIIVRFGGAGDLLWRKLIPALSDLHREGRMPE